MNKHVFTQRILKGVAQAIRKGEKPFDKKRLAGEITDDCFTDTKEREIWRPIVAQRIDMLLSEEGALFTHMRDVCRAVMMAAALQPCVSYRCLSPFRRRNHHQLG